MILIDKSKDFQELVLTLSESGDGLTGYFYLILTSDSTKKRYSFQLPPNTSAFTERFDYFKIETDVFDDLNEGFYNYEISIADIVIEKGKAQVKSSLNTVQNIITPNSSNEILIYGE